jgi:hypothetical protein
VQIDTPPCALEINQRSAKLAQPQLGFQRVLQRGVFHTQSSGKSDVGACPRPRGP